MLESVGLLCFTEWSVLYWHVEGFHTLYKCKDCKFIVYKHSCKFTPVSSGIQTFKKGNLGLQFSE